MQMTNLSIVMVMLILKILRTMRMVVAIRLHPFIQLRSLAIQVCSGTQLVLIGIGPRIVMEVVVQLRVGTTECDRAELAAECTVVDIFRTPEISTGRQITKLHHP